MRVEQVLTPTLVRTHRSTTLAEAAMLMRERHIGTLLVTEDEPQSDVYVGIVTDRDMVVRAVADGVAPKECTVGEIMTSGLATIAPHATLSDALEAMRSRGVRRLVVAHDDGRPVGLVSLDDIVDALGMELAGVSRILRSELQREIGRTRAPAA